MFMFGSGVISVPVLSFLWISSSALIDVSYSGQSFCFFAALTEGGLIILLTIEAMAEWISVSVSLVMSRFTWCLRHSLHLSSGSGGCTMGGLSLSLHLSGCWLGAFSRSFTILLTVLSALRSVLTDGAWVIMSAKGSSGLGSLCELCTIIFWLLVFWIDWCLYSPEIKIASGTMSMLLSKVTFHLTGINLFAPYMQCPLLVPLYHTLRASVAFWSSLPAIVFITKTLAPHSGRSVRSGFAWCMTS